MSALPPILVELHANASEFMTKMGQARHEIGRLGTEGSAHSAKFAAVGKAALLGFAGVAVGVGSIAVHAALEGEKAHAALAQAVRNTGRSFDEMEPHVEAMTGGFAKLGFSRDELEQGLTVLTTSLRSPTAALRDIRMAADLARYKNISLADASLIVAKATEGQLKPLKALGIDLPVAAGGAAKLQSATTRLKDAQERYRLAVDKANRTTGKEHVKALAAVQYASLNVHTAQSKLNAVQGAARSIVGALASAVRGQATAAANTYAGKLNAAKAAAQNMAENLGNVLLPMIASLVTHVSEAVQWLQKHKDVAIALASIIGGVLTIAIGYYIAGLIKAGIESVKTFVEDVAKGVTWVATRVAQYASVAASAVASAAATTAAWVAAGAKAAAGYVLDAAKGAIWVAGKIAQYAVVAAAAIGSAVATAAAWVAANIAMIAATGGIVLAIGALVAAGIYLVTHWKQVWAFIKQAAADAWQGLKWVFDNIIWNALLPVRLYVMAAKLAFEIAWAGIKLAVSVGGAIISAVIGAIKRDFALVMSVLGSLRDGWNTVWNGLHSAVSAAWDFISPIINAIVGGLQHVVDLAGGVMNTIGKVGGAVGKVGHFLGLATGAYVTSPTLAMVGEGREPEYVLPESKLNRAVMQASANGGGGGGVSEVHLYIDGREVHAAVRVADRQFRLRNGQSAFA